MRGRQLDRIKGGTADGALVHFVHVHASICSLHVHASICSQACLGQTFPRSTRYLSSSLHNCNRLLQQPPCLHSLPLQWPNALLAIGTLRRFAPLFIRRFFRWHRASLVPFRVNRNRVDPPTTRARKSLPLPARGTLHPRPPHPLLRSHFSSARCVLCTLHTRRYLSPC